MTQPAHSISPSFETLAPGFGLVRSVGDLCPLASTVPQFKQVGQHFGALTLRKRAELVGCTAAIRGLSALGAPDELLRPTRGVVANLVKHVDMYADLSRRYGCCPERGTQQSIVRLDVYELAEDNFVRGCLSCAVQAEMAQYQARAASDDAVRITLGEIAADDRRHSDLAWQTAAWLIPQLTREQRLQLQDIRQRAIARARHLLERPASAELQYFAGIPPSTDALSLFDSMIAERFTECLSAGSIPDSESYSTTRVNTERA